MGDIRLIAPSQTFQTAAEAFKREFFDAGETVIHGSSLLDQMEYSDWLRHVERGQDPATVREGWVPFHTFFAQREEDGQLVGIIDLRHSLDNDFLARYGGHIGYAVRPSERRKGYAGAMLRQVLAFASGALGMESVRLGCYADNLASRRTIASCGGHRVETKPYLDGRPMELWQIDLPDPGRGRGEGDLC